jgi:glycosyltransferase domain-containing protein
MKNSPLSDLTLVMPTYNRQRYALRNMHYWSGSGVVMHVLDGSQDALRPDQLKLLDSNINYHHRPVSMYQRLQKAIDLVETRFVALIGDDEFFIPSALVSCIDELQRKTELVACMGRCLAFNCTSGGVTAYLAYQEMGNHSLNQEDALARMLEHMSSYTPSTIYSVVRAPVWKKSMTTLVQKEFRAYSIGEVQFELATSYQGKTKVIPELIWMRSNEAEPTRGTDPSLMPEHTLHDWWLDPGKEDERIEFLHIMSATLADSSDEIKRTSDGVRLAVDTFVKRRLDKLNVARASRVRRFKKFGISLVPAGLKLFLKANLRVFYTFNDVRSLSLAARDLEATGVKVDFEEIRKIQAIVLKFHSA